MALKKTNLELLILTLKAFRTPLWHKNLGFLSAGFKIWKGYIASHHQPSWLWCILGYRPQWVRSRVRFFVPFGGEWCPSWPARHFWSIRSGYPLSICRLKKRTHQTFINTHHQTHIIKFTTIICGRKNSHKLPICKNSYPSSITYPKTNITLESIITNQLEL